MMMEHTFRALLFAQELRVKSETFKLCFPVAFSLGEHFDEIFLRNSKMGFHIRVSVFTN